MRPSLADGGVTGEASARVVRTAPQAEPVTSTTLKLLWATMHSGRL